MNWSRTPWRISWNLAQSLVMNQAITSMSRDDAPKPLNRIVMASGQIAG